MSILTRDSILKADDLKKQLVEVPEWGGSVYVRTLTGTERDNFEQSIIEAPGKMNMANLRARLVSKVLVDDKGQRLFTNADAVELGTKSASALDRIFTIAQKMNGMSTADVEEMVKNSGAAPSGGSTSD